MTGFTAPSSSATTNSDNANADRTICAWTRCCDARPPEQQVHQRNQHQMRAIDDHHRSGLAVLPQMAVENGNRTNRNRNRKWSNVCSGVIVLVISRRRCCTTSNCRRWQNQRHGDELPLHVMQYIDGGALERQDRGQQC